MSRALRDLQRRRAVLCARSGMERRRLAGELAVVAQPLACADRAVGRARRLVSQPALALGLIGALLAIRPRRILKWSGPLLAAWRLWRAFRGQR
ncbi:YqjK family protein [Ramlibacter sp. MAHUQ-53]|uniref:YqjK family protein n=1 Tax=unclassified Ramlibacter TaxID=2617605 RepID=UPI00363EF296